MDRFKNYYWIIRPINNQSMWHKMSSKAMSQIHLPIVSIREVLTQQKEK
jgi:hypothetical protein